MQRVDEETLNRLWELWEQYKEVMPESKYTKDTQKIRVSYVRQFIEWAAGKPSTYMSC